MKKNKKILILCQVYEPDPAAVGQYVADIARELVKNGEHVLVLTSREGYDNPSIKYPKYEILDGVEVKRIPFSSFGKKRIFIRLAGQLSFLLQAFCFSLFLGNIKKIVITTVPPMTSIFGSLLSKIKKTPVTFWVMDINPDQLIRMGKISENSLTSRIFNMFNRSILKQATSIITLDEAMADTLNKKMEVSEKLSVIPLWPLDNYIDAVSHSNNHFRKMHGLENKFVIMYSGNHSPVNPLDTVIEAAKQLGNDPRFVFVFIGGGQEKSKIEKAIQTGLKNIISLPYQSLDMLKYSLSAADVHIVSIGNEMVGVVHPCKIYGVMKVGRPIISLGPENSHLAKLISEYGIGKNIEHGNVKNLIKQIYDIYNMSPQEQLHIFQKAKNIITNDFNREKQCKQICNLVKQKQNIIR